MAGLAKMLYSPKIEEILAELEDYGGTTLGELLAFMRAYNLRFAEANSFRQRRIYMKLYPLLARAGKRPHPPRCPERLAAPPPKSKPAGRPRSQSPRTGALRPSTGSNRPQSIFSRKWTGNT